MNRSANAKRSHVWSKKKHFGAKGPKQKFKKKVNKSTKDKNEVEDLQKRYEQSHPQSVRVFHDLPLSSYTQRALKEAGYATPTEIQRESIGLALQGHDILGAAKTGSGKTLAFLVPLLERLFTLRWSRPDGLGALVITPTRELAYQIFEQLQKVGKYHDFSAGLVIGGKDLHFESKRMAECNIVICTPGRLLQHMDENPQFDPVSLQVLILDEADRCLDMGFAEQMNAILENLPKERQTLLFSATQTRSVKDLARLSLEKPVFISVHEHSAKATPDELTENYIVCNLDEKIDLLWSFIKTYRKKKIIVFVQCCKQVKYYSDLFKRLRIPTKVWSLYGTLNQLRRMAIYKEFCETQTGVLIATDLAARGLDFPTVDWVYQMDCPEDWKAYNHRVGRTARNKSVGQALLLLMPTEEESMLKQLRIQKFSLEKLEVNPQKLTSIQRKIQASLASDNELKAEAQRAFQSYLKSIFLMKDKTVFDVFQLNTDAFAASLGLAVAPRVRFLQRQLKIKAQKTEDDSRKKTVMKLGSDSEDGDDEDFLKVKRVDHDLTDEEGDVKEESEQVQVASSKKALTKAGAAKKLLKKKLQINSKVKFDDEGQLVEESLKTSDVGRQYEKEDESAAGIDFEKVRNVLKAEDEFDKKREKARVKQVHKEKKRKEKEAKNKREKAAQDDTVSSGEEAANSDSEDEPNLSWLPDPDKVYGKQHESEEESESEEERIPKGKWKPPKKPKAPKAKRARVEDQCEEYDLDKEDLVDDEMLALKLLGK